MDETIHGNWDPHVKIRHYFIRNTPLFCLLSDCHLVDNHMYFHEKHKIVLLSHSAVLSTYLFYIARWQCVFKCSFWELHCVIGA